MVVNLSSNFCRVAALAALVLIALNPSQAFAPQNVAVGPVLHINYWKLPSHQLAIHKKHHGARRQSVSALKFPTLDTSNKKSLISAASFIVLDVAFRRLFNQYKIAFPSSLGGCGFLFALLLALPSSLATKLFDYFSPGAALLAKWLPVFFVPSLVTLPLADSVGSAAELLKVGFVIVGGFLFTLLTTSWSVVSIRKLFSSSTSEATEKNAAVLDSVANATTTTTSAATTSGAIATNSKAFSDETFTLLGTLTALSGLAAVTLVQSKPLNALFLLSTTLASFVFGARLPKLFSKVVHPLVTCTALTWGACLALSAAGSSSFRTILKSYRVGSLAGPGDILLFLLGPAVVSLAISMYGRRKLMRENLAEVSTAVMTSTFGGLFGTALAVRLLDIADPFLRLSLLSRNITSPLAMAIAGILGADISLAVSFVVVSGLIGANFGAALLTAAGIKDPVARGLGIGAAAHGLGTAAFANEKDAFPFAAIAMALTASGATVVVSIPLLKRMILQLALGA